MTPERDIQLPAILAGACLLGGLAVLFVVMIVVPVVRALCTTCQ